MLLLIGPQVTSMQNYTKHVEATSIALANQQGNTLDTLKFQLWDPTSSVTIQPEDQCLILEENDPNGWPTVNLLPTPLFQAPFTSGVASGWTLFNSGSATGFTWASNANAYAGATSQSISLNNAGTGLTSEVYQFIKPFPTDENGALVASLPYSFTVWYYINTVLVGATVSLAVDWYTITGTLIRTDSQPITNSASNAWLAATVALSPPSNANYCAVDCRVQTTSATNSGQVLWGGVQAEYQTFSNYASTTLAPALYNNNMVGHAPGTVVDQWQQDNPIAGLTYSQVAAPNSMQQLVWSALASSASNRGIKQSFIEVNPACTYTVSMTYAVTGAISAGTTVRAYFACKDKNNNSLGTTLQLVGPDGQGVVNTYTITDTIGALGNQLLPIGTYQLDVGAGFLVTSGTSSGTLQIDSISIMPIAPQYQLPAAEATVARIGLYPTPLVNPTLIPTLANPSPGTSIYQDRGYTNCYYRQNRVFGGYVRVLKLDYGSGPERIIDCDGVDYGVILAEAPATIVLRAPGTSLATAATVGVSDSVAITQACVYAANQGFLVGLDYTIHVASLSSIPAMAFNWNSTRDVLSAIADSTQAAYWVDANKYLWYQSPLTNSQNYSLSDTPDMTTSFPFADWSINEDSTQTQTTSVIMGSTQLSSPQTMTFNGLAGTSGVVTSADLPANPTVAYTSFTCSAMPVTVLANTELALGGSNGLLALVATDCLATPTGAPSLSTNATASTFTAAIYKVAYTWLYANGLGGSDETQPSPITSSVTMSSGTSIQVAALAAPTAATGAKFYVSTTGGGSTLGFVKTVNVVAGNIPVTTLSAPGNAIQPPAVTTVRIVAANPSADTPVGTVVQSAGFVVNGGQPIYQIDSVTVTGLGALTLGTASTQSTGEQAYFDPQPALVTFDWSVLNGTPNYPATAVGNVTIIYRFMTPVLVRVTAAGAGKYTDGRLIFFYQNVTNIQSVSDATDQANANLAQYQKAQPIGSCVVYTPPWPIGVPIRQGQAVSIKHVASGYTSPTKFQVQKVSTGFLGNGVIVRKLDLGYWRPDFSVALSQITQDAAHLASTVNASSVLTDVLNLQDAFVYTDTGPNGTVKGTPNNSGVWAPAAAQNQSVGFSGNKWNDGTVWS